MSKTLEQTPVADTTQDGNPTIEQTPQAPVFEEVEGMTDEGAVNVVIQAASMAQSTGQLTVRDSVILAKAISVLRPGSI
mgnify:CR=1 FL=1|jgi:hypothetical protein|tara:strand:- start:212 stop:448 length:237 start_codon:yes stop_codon:yes gene_type:complete